MARLGRQTFHDTFAEFNSPEDMAAFLEESFNIELLTKDISEPGSVYLLAEKQGEALGFARLIQCEPPACITGPSPVRLLKIYVDANAIGHGVGAALMRSSIDWAKAADHQTVWLGVWEHNGRAKSFYERWKFVPVGTETFRLGSDDQTDILMQLEIGT